MKLAHDPLCIPEAVDFINQLMPTLTVDMLSRVDHTTLDQTWRNWLESSSHNTIAGLNTFKHSAFSAGTSPVFGEFISRYPTRRVRVSRSDFIITRILARTYNRELVYLEDAPLSANDCVILSVPFSGNGSYYPTHTELFDQADALEIPVFVDGAYFGISHGIKYPLDRDCVTDFATSLSKHIAGVPFRMGIRFTRQVVDDGISASLLGSNVFDRLNSYLSIQLLNQFSHDWIINRYRNLSNLVCTANNLTSTNTVTIAIGTPEMEEFKRGDFTRVCISEELNRLS